MEEPQNLEIQKQLRANAETFQVKAHTLLSEIPIIKHINEKKCI